MTILFTKSLKKSKKLSTFSKIIFYPKPFNVSAVLQNIQTVKKLNNLNPIVLSNISSSLHSLRLVNIVFNELTKLQKEKVELNNEAHLFLLETLWDTLKPNLRRKKDSNDWSEIGFQGKDPTTDFRGMGLLGLYQLHYFSINKTDIAHKILLNFSNPNRYMPFSAIGINFTSFIIELFNEYRFHKLIFINLEKIQLYSDLSSANQGPSTDKTCLKASCDVIHNIYCEIYEEFFILWEKWNPKNVLDFPKVYNELKEKFRKQYPPIC
jgi:hypothetical protein